MYCRYCGEELSDKSKFCPKCGSKIENESKVINQEINYKESEEEINDNDTFGDSFDNVNSAKGTEKKHTNNNFRFNSKFFKLGFIVFIIVICWAIFSKPDMDTALISCSKQVISEHLKSPSTAEFSDEEVLEVDNYGRGLVVLTVDAQNGFGAYVRNRYVLVITSVDLKTGEFTYSKSSIMEISGNDPKADAFNIEFAKQMADWNKPIN